MRVNFNSRCLTCLTASEGNSGDWKWKGGASISGTPFLLLTIRVHSTYPANFTTWLVFRQNRLPDCSLTLHISTILIISFGCGCQDAMHCWKSLVESHLGCTKNNIQSNRCRKKFHLLWLCDIFFSFSSSSSTLMFYVFFFKFFIFFLEFPLGESNSGFAHAKPELLLWITLLSCFVVMWKHQCTYVCGCT